MFQSRRNLAPTASNASTTNVFPLFPGFIASTDDAGDAFELAKDCHTTMIVQKHNAQFSAYEKQQDRKRIQNFFLIMLNLTEDSVDRLKFECGAQYTEVGSSEIALIKLLLFSHRPAKRVLDRFVITMFEQLKAKGHGSSSMVAHINLLPSSPSGTHRFWPDL